MDNMLIVDGSSLLCESYFGTVPKHVLMKDKSEWPNYYHEFMRTKTGIFTNGIFTAMNKLEKIIASNQFTHLIVCLDTGTSKNARVAMFPDYKGNREEKDYTLTSQLSMFPIVLISVGIATCFHGDYEADDLIGTLSSHFSAVMPVTIMSGDQDLTQLVKPGVKMWYSCKSSEKAQALYDDYTQGQSNSLPLSALNLPDKIFPITETSVKYLMKVKACQVAELKALHGDASDNYPGVSGIGEKGAVALLNYFNNIDEIFKKVDSIGSDKTILTNFKKDFKEKTEVSFPWKALSTPEAREQAYLFKRIASICCDIPEYKNISPDVARISLNLNKRKEIYEQLEFYSLLHKNFAA